MVWRPKWRSVVGTLVVICHVFQVCEGTGKIEFYLKRFEGDCTDNGILRHECDTYFKLCLDRQRTPNVNRCDYVQKTTSHYHDDNSMDFGSNINGVDNPLLATITSFQTSGVNDVMFAMEAWDKDAATGDDQYASLSVNLSLTPAASSNEAAWRNGYTYKGNNHVWYRYRFYCDAYYHTNKCSVYCKARDDDLGHYTCFPETGQKKCIIGWTGENCEVDINECSMKVCYHNAACTNLPGSYQCACPQGYAGQNCDLVDSQCHSSPCQNGGRCTGNMQEYNCTCPFQWSGKSCETQVDFCESSPCRNSATCYGTLGNYTCACAPGWTGDHCTTEVNACDSTPCENSGNCFKKPNAQYECTCPVQYDGKNCSALKDPCDPNPCQNSGTCSMLTYNTYNCSCVYGWVGDDCSSYLNVSASTQQQSKGDDEKVDPLPILLGILAAFSIVVIILAVFFIRRRKKQQKAVEAGLRNGDLHHSADAVQYVTGSEGLAFPNALYERTNRTNSMLEARGTGSCSSPRPPMPVPPCGMGFEDVFNMTNPKVFGEKEEQGANGGCNPYQDIDAYQTPGKCMVGGTDKAGSGVPCGEAHLDTRTLAGAKNHYDTISNHYADFEDLKQRAMAVKEAVGYANTPESPERMEEAEENHYHDLEDLRLDITTSGPNRFTSGPDPFTAGPDPFTFGSDPFASSPDPFIPSPDPFTSVPDPFKHTDPTVASHYDTPLSARSSAVTAPGHDAAMTYRNDLSVPSTTVGDGYMQMAGSTSREVQLDALESSDEEGVFQEDIEKLRKEAMWSPATQSCA